MPGADTQSADIAARDRVARLMDGYMFTQLLYVAARLGIADALAGGPQSAETLARDVAAQAPALRRVLRGLAAEGIFEEHPGGRLGLTPLGDYLRRDAPGRERTAAEYAHLLAAAGLHLARVIPTRSSTGISLFEATPTNQPPADA